MDKRASSQVVIPQILTRVGIGFWWHRLQPVGFGSGKDEPPQAEARATSRTQQLTQRLRRVRLSHKMLADEERVKARGPETRQIAVSAQSRFANGDAFFGDGLDQFL